MSSKKVILYGVYHDWTDEISVVYQMDKESYFPENKFEGDLENGQPNGNGIWTQCCGATYVGQFVNGLREGLGVFTWSIHSPDGVGLYEGVLIYIGLCRFVLIYIDLHLFLFW